MKIIITESAGFCDGVRDALIKLDAVSEQDEVKPILLGPLVNNRSIMQDLAERGYHQVKLAKEAPPGSRLALPTHGSSPKMRLDLEAQGFKVLDCTCQVVFRLMSEVRMALKAGRRVAIYGDRNDPEIKAVLAMSGKQGLLITSPRDVAKIPEGDPITLVSQTTADRMKFDAVAAAVQKRWLRANVRITSCMVAWAKQEEVRRLCGNVDALVVIGDWTSSNVRRLVEIARERGRKVTWVQDASELRKEFFEDVHSVGVESGTSVPDNVITGVVRTIREFTEGEESMEG